ncbi:sigma 54-interacting transcriptional regulator [Pendulispora albinea]|uniref:Sigma 54-interacting transcriptional regulator n=1 Tax=Pendulispora albinea TaxID=2741071 RepID=A0ABZ2M354_9BACT
MQRIFARAVQLVDGAEPLHITGEPGTGKRYFAEALHRQSARAEKPFLVVDCKAIAYDQLEDELFGREAGAYPEAPKKDSVFVAADGGTVYLNEVERLPLEAQARLLLVVERGEVRARNQSRPRAVDVRIITSNSVDLAGRVNDGMFHADLYARLCKTRLHFPALRERRRDIELLTRAILVDIGYAKAFDALDRDTVGWMKRQEWREGNIAQLRHVLAHAAGRWMAEGGRLDVETSFFVHRETDPLRSEASRREIALRVLTRDGSEWSWESAKRVAASLLYEALERKTGGVVLRMAKLAGTSRHHVYKHHTGERGRNDDGKRETKSTKLRASPRGGTDGDVGSTGR